MDVYSIKVEMTLVYINCDTDPFQIILNMFNICWKWFSYSGQHSIDLHMLWETHRQNVSILGPFFTFYISQEFTNQSR